MFKFSPTDDNVYEIIKGLQKQEWTIGDPGKVVEIEARVRELEAEKQLLVGAIEKHKMETFFVHHSDPWDKELYAVLDKVTSK